MKNWFFSTLMMLLILISGHVFSAPSSQARLKCWINDQNVRECGDKVPPEYIQLGHQELDKGGLVRGEIKPAKTNEELAEEKRLAKIEAEKRSKIEEQVRQDRILLNTFSEVEDIERARDERVAIVETSIKLTNVRNKKMHQELNKRIHFAATAEKNGQTPSESLLNDIASLKRQIKNNDTFIAEKRLEQEEIQGEHSLYIKRFKELNEKK